MRNLTLPRVLAVLFAVLAAFCCGACSSSSSSSSSTTGPTITTTQANLTGSPATECSPYSFTFAESGGVAPVTWSAGTTLPAGDAQGASGISLNSATGEISGTAGVSGTIQFTLQVVDNDGNDSPIDNFSLTVNPGSGSGCPDPTAVEDGQEEAIGPAAGAATITTLAGNGVAGYAGDGAAATLAELDQPAATAVDTAGDVYVADALNERVREVLASGEIVTVAGNGRIGYSGDGGPASVAELDQPLGVAVDSSGNVYIADAGNHVVRMVAAATGTITTVAGDGSAGDSGDGGAATAAGLREPAGLALDGLGHLFIADAAANTIRRVTLAGGTITTVAGTGTAGYSGNGGAATAATLRNPVAVALDASGNLYIADAGNNVIREVTTSGSIATVAGSGSAGAGGDGGSATAAQLNDPGGVVVDAAGDVYISDLGNNRVRVVVAGTGIIATLAGTGTAGYGGDGGAAAAAKLWGPEGLTLDAAGNLYVADALNNRVRTIIASLP